MFDMFAFVVTISSLETISFELKSDDFKALRITLSRTIICKIRSPNTTWKSENHRKFVNYSNARARKIFPEHIQKIKYSSLGSYQCKIRGYIKNKIKGMERTRLQKMKNFNTGKKSEYFRIMTVRINHLKSSNQYQLL